MYSTKLTFMLNILEATMIRTLAAVLTLVMLGMGSTISMTAQDNSLAPAPTQSVTLKPKMPLGDVKAVSNFIQGVEIRGTEVDAYLDTRKVLTEVAKKATDAGKKDEDEIVVELRLDQAQNLFTLMQRGKLTGAEAEKYKQIIDSLREAVKVAQDAAK
jgi:hypothetical protein